MQFPSHGANFQSLYKTFGIQQPDRVFDLSENVNFLGPTKSVVEAWPSLLNTITTYPNPEAEPLRSTLAKKHHVKPEQILVGNGAAELLTFFAQRFKGKKVILMHPTFSEYKATLEAAGALLEELVVSDLQHYQLPILEVKQTMRDASCLYLCNPNNPTGSLIKRDILEEFIAYGKEVGCEILVDEAFMDWTDEMHSVIDLIEENEHVTVMRSMTKMYTIAGIRLGYLIGSPSLVQQIRSMLPHWNVNSLAIAIGDICINDDEFRYESIMRTKEIKEDLQQFLEERQCVITNSAANFLCFQLDDPSQTRDFYFHCLKRGIVLRHTENYRGMDGKWLRIGMKGHDAMSYFKEVMDDWYE